MKCDKHNWDTEDKEWCWKCEEITLQENKEKYENKLCDYSLQRTTGDKKTSTFSFGTQETGR